MATPGSHHHHCKEIGVCEFLYNELFNIQPLWMTFVYILSSDGCRNLEKSVEFPFKLYELDYCNREVL